MTKENMNVNDITMHKLISSQDVKMKAVSNELGHMQFEGYLAVFNNVDHAGDIILPGAFKNTLAEIKAEGKTVPIIEMHDMWDRRPLGFFLEMKEDDYGLWVKGQLYSTEDGKAIHTILKESPSGSIGMSIGYRIVKLSATNKDDPGALSPDGSRWYLEELKLKEGSIVYSIPCNELAVVNDVKSQSMEKRRIEKALKERGFSGKDATTAVSALFEILEEDKKEMTTEEFYKASLENGEQTEKSVESSGGLAKLLGTLENLEKAKQEEEASKVFSIISKNLEELQEEKKNQETELKLKKLSENLEKHLTT